MERINQYQLYETGKEIAKISTLPDEPTIAECFFAFFHSTWKLRSFVKGAATMRLSTRAANEILGAISAIQKQHMEDQNGAFRQDLNFEQKIESFQIGHLKKLAQTFETIFAAEAVEAATYLRENVFPGKRMKMLQAAPGGGVAVTEW